MTLRLIPMTGYEQFNFFFFTFYTNINYRRKCTPHNHAFNFKHRMVGPLFSMQFVVITLNVLKLS